ncbi:20883_t:CDS:2, partial [Racocetra persica]
DKNDRVQVLEYHQKSANKKNISNTNITDKDKKEILEEDSECVECEESVREPKLKDNYRL